MPSRLEEDSIKNILLPIGFYGDFQKSLKNILSFFQGLQGHPKLILLNTYNVPVSAPDRVIDVHDEARKQSLDKLKNEFRAAQELSGDGKVSFETLSQMGSPANVISRVVKERSIDCVILGKNGFMKQEELASLVGRVPCAIFILPT